MLSHANVFANVYNFNYWMRYREAESIFTRRRFFHIADSPTIFAASVPGQVAVPRFSPPND
jgi:hypothetical protein